MKNYLFVIVFLFLSVIQIRAQDPCTIANLNFVWGWTVTGGTINNICGENGRLNYSVDFFYYEDDASVSDIFEVRILYYPGDLYIVKDVIGATGYTESTASNGLEQIIATVELTGSGTPNQGVEHNLTIQFYLSDYISPSTDDMFHSLKLANDPIFCYNIKTDLLPAGIINTQAGGNVEYFNAIVETPDNVLSGRIASPISNQTSGDFQIVDFMDIDVNFDLVGSSHFFEEVWLCDNAELIISAQDEITFANYNFSSLSEYNTISVKDGATLKLTNCTISNAVNGITVESGGTLILDKVTISSCSESGIKALGGSNIILKDCNLEFNEIGLLIDGNVNVQNLEFNNINNNSKGIKINNTLSLINLNHININTLESNIVGLEVNLGNSTIGNIDFINNSTGIYLRQTEVLEIQNCFISGSVSAVRGDFCKFDFLDNTIINCNVGFDISASNDYSIFNNDIDASQLATRIYWSKGEIDNNRIGQYEIMQRGLHQIFTNDEIQDNTISTNHTNILANSIFNSSIDHNNLLGADYGYFAVGGTSEAFVEYNIIVANTSGVLYNSAGTNNTGCNEIDAEEAIWVRDNSDLQDLITNQLDGSENDVLIYSVLGVQEHNGNEFLGENVTAIGLNFNEIKNSSFIVDQNDQSLIPDNPNPPELVDPEPFIGTPKNCDGLTGSRMKQRFLDPIIMCAYLQKIEGFKISNPQYYWNRMYHLMRYYLLEIPLAQWPNCINFAWSNEDMCGLKVIVENEVEIKNLLIGSQSATNLKSSFDSIKSNQTVELSGLECVLDITSIWKDVYLLMLKRINGEDLSLQDQNVLESAATKCSAEYGDAVHWARSLLSEYNSNDYYVNDNCTLSVQQNSRTDRKLEKLSFRVSPNPVLDVLHVNSNIEDIRYTLYDTNGKTIMKGQLKSLSFDIDMHEVFSGSYILEIVSPDGQKAIEKIIKIN